MGKLLTKLTVGRTQRLGPFILQIDNQPYSLTGHNVELKLRSSLQAAYYDTAGDVTVDPDQSEAGNRGHVYYDPDPEDFNRPGTFFLKWKVTDGAGKVVHFPEEEADWIEVVQA